MGIRLLLVLGLLAGCDRSSCRAPTPEEYYGTGWFARPPVYPGEYLQFPRYPNVTRLADGSCMELVKMGEQERVVRIECPCDLESSTVLCI